MITPILFTMLVVLVAPPVAWLLWFLFCTPLSAKVGIYFSIGPGQEFGFQTNTQEFYWCPFGFISFLFKRMDEGAE